MRTLHANGFGQFMPYPSTGLDYDYLGEDFFRMMGWFIDEARRLGLKVWLYDEFNWPSGTARGRVPAENEDCLYRELVAVTNAADPSPVGLRRVTAETSLPPRAP